MTNGSFIDDLSDIPGFNQFTGRAKDRGLVTAEEAADMTFEGDVGHDNRPAKERPTYPCESCGGTGTYRGVRIHQSESKCFACNGRGYFYTSTKDRMAQRYAAAKRKQSKAEQTQAVFHEANPGLIEKLRAISSWNSFAASMLENFDRWNGLTERQVAACLNMLAKVEARKQEKAATREANTGEVDTSKIEAMFNVARENGLKKLAFVADGLRIKPAKASSVNAGALYVTLGSYDSYQGKIINGRFIPVGSAHADTLAKLREIAENPSQAARDYGKRTGVCCCCGRELTDPASIAAGIGPICATKWGL